LKDFLVEKVSSLRRKGQEEKNTAEGISGRRQIPTKAQSNRAWHLKLLGRLV
jgi:hypothetical protein